jgi:tetratricopeptide (TPR) repeat protein
MAQTCAGNSAAGDPARSGIDRANAYFNAAAAYNAAAARAPSAVCETSSACSQTALTLLERSTASQQDNQISLAGSPAKNAVNERFILRRKLEQSRALRGVANGGASNASCGTKTACLTTAADLLAPINVEPWLSSTDEATAHLGCELLDARWRANNDLGRQREYKYVEDLRRVVSACPTFAASASDRLAEISFERAETVRQSLARTNSTTSLAAAQGAITDYRDALSASRFKLPAYRGMGNIYQSLARRDPAGASTYLESAADALNQAVTLGAATETADARAIDMGQLGNSLIGLARVTGQPGSPERRALFERAAQSLQDAVNLAPTSAHYASLGEAYGELGKCQASISAYQSAIPGQAGTEKVSTYLALSGMYEQCEQPELALQTLKQALAQGAVSADVQFKIGSSEYGKGNFRAALTALRSAESGLNSADAAEANYMISVAEIVTRPAGWQKSALGHAERAVSLNTRNWTYNRQACLATILNGDKTVKEGSSIGRCPDAGTPEASLLRGMYFLKQAQSMDVSAYDLASQTRWRSVLRAAETAFTRGQEPLAAAKDSERTVRFDDLQANVDISSRLQQGLKVVQRCNREITLGPDDPAWKDIDAFYGRYGVLKCS